MKKTFKNNWTIYNLIIKKILLHYQLQMKIELIKYRPKNNN